MMTSDTFATIDRDLLAATLGGDGQGQPAPAQPQGDFAHRYVANIKQDWNDAQSRANRVVSNFRQGNYWEAGKQFAAQTLDNVGLIGDAIAPFRALSK
jgi:hypothetical protein